MTTAHLLRDVILLLVGGLGGFVLGWTVRSWIAGERFIFKGTDEDLYER